MAMGAIIAILYMVNILFPILQAGPGDPGNQAPITEGIILLLAGAIGYGVKTFSKKNKK